MDETFEELFSSTKQSPSYWMQVALLEFLQSLDAIRTSRGDLSSKALASLVGVSPATLSRWLNGNENLTVSTMCRLATAMGGAVHIHVADKDEKGTWRPEIGRALSRETHDTLTASFGKLTDFSSFKTQRSKPSIVVTTDSETPNRSKNVASFSGKWRSVNG
jgi:transcriptional regulator with XRE-family HTH domain